MIADNEKTTSEAEVAAGENPESAINRELQNIDQGSKINESAPTLRQISQILNLASFAAMLLHTLTALLVGIVQIIMLGLGVVIVKILVILDSFVFAFSILPVFQRQLSNWFSALCSVDMVFTVINILNQITWFTFKSIYGSDALNVVGETTKQLQYLGMGLASIDSYYCCFWLANKVVGYGDANRIISGTVPTVTAAVTMAIIESAIVEGGYKCRGCYFIR